MSDFSSATLTLRWSHVACTEMLLLTSTKTTYKTGVINCIIFQENIQKSPSPLLTAPTLPKCPSLVFFAAYLFEIDTNKTYSTIRNYISLVKQFYVKTGYPKSEFDTAVHKAVKRGIEKGRLPKADSRAAFLLFDYHIRNRL